MASPKVVDTITINAESFPLKKDDRLMKPLKPVEEKKTAQKPTESSLAKKMIESTKKNKREKRDLSSDSDDSDGIYFTIYFTD